MAGLMMWESVNVDGLFVPRTEKSGRGWEEPMSARNFAKRMVVDRSWADSEDSPTRPEDCGEASVKSR
jgi:hypothetical protein